MLHLRITWLFATGDVGMQVLARVSDDARPQYHLNKQDASVQFDYLVISSGKRISDW